MTSQQALMNDADATVAAERDGVCITTLRRAKDGKSGAWSCLCP